MDLGSDLKLRKIVENLGGCCEAVQLQPNVQWGSDKSIGYCSAQLGRNWRTAVTDNFNLL